MSDVRAWEIVDADGKGVAVRLNRQDAEHARWGGLSVTPLVAAPPALAHPVTQRLRRRIEEARTRGGMRVGMPRADVDENDLECLVRWVEGAAVDVDGAALPAPTYAELVEGLREMASAVAAYFPFYAAECLNSGRTRSNEELTTMAERARALLSRLPKEG